MPTAADYSATASSVYDPQAAAESTQAAASRDSAIAGLTGQDAAIDKSFGKAADTLKTARSDQAARTDFQYTNALDGNSSGLKGNQDARESGDYLKSLEGLTDDQATQHTTVASQRQAAITSYQSQLQAITQKYSGIKSGFVADMLSKDSDRAFQEKLADKANAASVAAANAYNAKPAAAPDPAQELNKDIYSSLNGFLTRPRGYSESTILPALKKQYAAQVGGGDISKGSKLIEDAFYSTRKSLGYG